MLLHVAVPLMRETPKLYFHLWLCYSYGYCIWSSFRGIKFDLTLKKSHLLVSELNPLQVVNLDPPTLFGAWLTGDIFIGGNLQGLHGAIRIEAHKVTT